MALKVYVGRDRLDVAREPDYRHEVAGIYEICRQLWALYEGDGRFCAVMAGPRQLGRDRFSADLVVLTEYGIGVVELKHSDGVVDCSRPHGPWYRVNRDGDGKGSEEIKGGIGDTNPHHQVQRYAAQIRHRLLAASDHGWLPGTPKAQRNFRFHTAVCFTNPTVDISKCQEAVGRLYRHRRHRGDRQGVLQGWERFSVLTPAAMPQWTLGLRFEAHQGREEDFAAYQLTETAIREMVAALFAGTEWTGMMRLLSQGEPYAYLTLRKQGTVEQIFRLTRPVNVIGRDKTCNLLLPASYRSVSRQHARFTCVDNAVYIEDLGSKNGTYVNGERLEPHQRRPLLAGQQIRLGSEPYYLAFHPYSAAADETGLMQVRHPVTTQTDVGIYPGEASGEVSAAETIGESNSVIRWLRRWLRKQSD